MYKKIAVVAVSLVLVCGCTRSARQVLGVSKSTPNEFSVVSNPPLSVPPNFSLVTPDSNAKSEAARMDTSARDILLEKKSSGTKDGTSKGEKAFLAKAGTEQADPDIRNKLSADQAAIEKEQDGLLDKVSFLPKKKEKDSIVNAKKEKDRILKDKEEGRPITEGETPVIEGKKDSGFLNRVFGL